jgi:hypothetical protein
LGHYPLEPFMVKLFGGRLFRSVPASFTRRNGQLPGRCLPTPAALCELFFSQERKSPHPAGGITLRQVAIENRLSNCSRTLVAASPALYRHGLLNKITFVEKVFPSRPDSSVSLKTPTYRIESPDYSFNRYFPKNEK